MKIVCDSCGAKYQIADDKVAGKAFKLKCKKCGHIIVVNRSASEASSAQQADGGGAAADVGAAPDAAAAPAEPAPASDSVWHLVLGQDQVGPMTAEEVRAKVQGGQADAETFGWKEGFADWLKLSAIDDFKSLFAGKPAADDQATRRSEPEEQPRAPETAAPSADLFAGGSGGGLRASPAAETLIAENAAVPARRAESPTAASADPNDEAVKAMTGARSENSVLFSLNNLSALAGADGGGPPARASQAQSAAAKPGFANAQSEASGLIDIRAMAAAHLGTGSQGGPAMKGGPELAFGGSNDPAPVFTPLAPAVLMPATEPQGAPKWVFALAGLGALIVVGMVITLVVFLKDSPPTQVATGPTAGQGAGTGAGTGATGPATGPATAAGPTTGPAPTGPTPTGTNTTAAPTTKPAGTEPGTTSKPEKGGKAEKGGSKSERGEKPSKGKEPAAKAEKEPEIPSRPAAPEPPPPPKPKKPAASADDLDNLLNSAAGGGSGGKPVKEAKKDLPEQLSMSQVKDTLKGVNVSSCKDQGASGVVSIKLTIGRNGRVSDASGSGGGADCVAKAVKGAKFPEFSGDPMTLTFPFIVR